MSPDRSWRPRIGRVATIGLLATGVLLATAAMSAAPPAPPPPSTDELLEPDVAFKASATLVGRNTVEIRYETAPGYYLYRDRLTFAIDPATVRLGKPKLPAGKVKNDEFFGRQVVYRKRTVVTIPVQWDGNGPLNLTADLQGCADLGVCYPPIRRTFTLAP